MTYVSKNADALTIAIVATLDEVAPEMGPTDHARAFGISHTRWSHIRQGGEIRTSTWAAYLQRWADAGHPPIAFARGARASGEAWALAWRADTGSPFGRIFEAVEPGTARAIAPC